MSMIDPTTLRETNHVLRLLDLPPVRAEEFDGMRTLMAQFEKRVIVQRRTLAMVPENGEPQWIDKTTESKSVGALPGTT